MDFTHGPTMVSVSVAEEKDQRMSEPVRIPIEHVLYVAEVVKRLNENGVPLDDLFVDVTPGEVELRDPTGSYGVRRFAAPVGG